MNRIIIALFGFCALLALSACGTSYPYQEKKVKVVVDEMVHTVHFPKGSSRIGLSERRKMAEFSGAIRPEAVRRVEIETKGDQGLSHSRAHLIREHFVKLGFPTPVFRHAYIKRTIPDVNVHVFVAKAIAPKNCPDWSSRATPNYSNHIHSNFGCATKTNLAAQAANPMDLEHGNNVGSPDPNRTQALMFQYERNTQIVNQADSASGGN